MLQRVNQSPFQGMLKDVFLLPHPSKYYSWQTSLWIHFSSSEWFWMWPRTFLSDTAMAEHQNIPKREMSVSTTQCERWLSKGYHFLRVSVAYYPWKLKEACGKVDSLRFISSATVAKPFRVLRRRDSVLKVNKGSAVPTPEEDLRDVCHLPAQRAKPPLREEGENFLTIVEFRIFFFFF